MSPTTDDLTRSLREHAERVTSASPSVPDVRRRASRIHRRRQGAALTAVAASVALAVGIPAALAANRHETVQPAGPVVEKPPASAVLDPASAPRGDDPAIPYAVNSGIRTPDDIQFEVPGEITAFAPLGEGWVVGGADGSGNGAVRLFDHAGRLVEDTQTDTLELAGSPSSDLVAYTNSDGTLYAVWDTPSGASAPFDRHPLPTIDGKTSIAAGLLGTRSCDPSSGAGQECVAYWNDGEGGAFVSTGDEVARQIPGLEKITGVAADGRIAGQVSSSDDGSCSAVLDQSQKQLWRTCDYSLGRFSPDGRYLVGYPAYRSGAGVGETSILDTRTWRPVTHFTAAAEDFVYDVAWESDTTLIATVHSGGAWQMLRLDIGGGVERAADPIEGDDYFAPVVLPTLGG